MTFIQIFLFAVCGLLFSLILRSMKSVMSSYVIAAVMIITAMLLVTKLYGMFTQLQELLAYASVNQIYINLLFKIVAMTYITHFTSALFKDNGYSAVADLLEVFCRISVASLSIPIVLSLFETVAKCI